MKKIEGEMRAEYKRSDFSTLQRGKFYKEIVKAFPTSEAVNQALRRLLTLTEQTARITRRSNGRSTKRRAA